MSQDSKDNHSASEKDPEAKAPADERTEEESPPTLHVVPVEPLDANHIRCVLEAALFAADDALTLDRLFKLFVPGELAEEGGRAQVREALTELATACEGRGFELKKVASGYRMQVRQPFSPWVSRLWEEKPPRYTRALLETMALIAYKQPATRGDIEEVRGVTVSSNIMRTLLERGWIREVGQRDVPGRPSMYGTTKEFLDYFNLSSLDELPSLPEIRELVEPAVNPAEPEPAPSDEARAENRSEATKALLARGAVEPDEVEPDEVEPGTDEDTEELAGEADTVFAEDEVLVVNEASEVTVQSESELGLEAQDTQTEDAQTEEQPPSGVAGGGTGD